MRHAITMRPVLLALLAAALLVGAATARDGTADHAPTVLVDEPVLQDQSAQRVGTTVSFHVTGTDPDGPEGLPVAWRVLFAPARLADGTPILTRNDYEAHVDELVDWGDANWSEWMPYQADPDTRWMSFANLEPGLYLFAAQVIDTTGVVSLGRDYQRQVAHVEATAGLQPDVVLCEYHLGCTDLAETYHLIASGQPLNFSWQAFAASYGGTITSYRHGWDLTDPNDPEDPGWAVPPGLSDMNLSDTERTFQEGMHSFYLLVTDDSHNEALVRSVVSVVPWVPRDVQKELLVIDQVHDANVQTWPDAEGNPRDDESYRNTFWSFLASGPGGVLGMDWNLDRFDHTQTPDLADVVAYKVVLCYARSHILQTMFGQLRPLLGADEQGNAYARPRFDWLAAYQQRGGNLFLVGDRSMMSFIPERPDYMTPVLFTATQDTTEFGGTPYVTGFGDVLLADGSTGRLGPMLHPYATAGVALLDWTASATKYVYGLPDLPIGQQRRVNCAGLKGLVLDEDFKVRHTIGPADMVRDTILTDTAIDWHDAELALTVGPGILTERFPWRDDEFVDADVAGRPESWSPQACDDPAAPGGLCVEPMFRGMARFDWLRQFWRDHGAPDWPTYPAEDLADSCGAAALAAWDPGDGGAVLPAGTAVTNGRVFGWLSYVNTADKPGGQPDVYWGFDPYRFDNAHMRDAVRWTLRHLGVNVLN